MYFAQTALALLGPETGWLAWTEVLQFSVLPSLGALALLLDRCVVRWCDGCMNCAGSPTCVVPLTNRQRLVLDATGPFFAFAWLGVVYVVHRWCLSRRQRKQQQQVQGDALPDAKRSLNRRIDQDGEDQLQPALDAEAELRELRRAYLRTVCALFLFTFSEVQLSG